MNSFPKMTDRVYPSSKPRMSGTTTSIGAPVVVIGTTTANPTSVKVQQLRPPYRPQPQFHHRRSNRNLCCCCCFWSILVLLVLSILAAIAGAAVYVLYRPHWPEFTISFLRISKLNITTDSESSTSRITTHFNLTLFSKNPNNHFTFFYEDFTLKMIANSVEIGNGTIPEFVSEHKNHTVFKGLKVWVSKQDLDVGSVTALKSDLKKRNGIPLKVLMDTKVKIKMGKLTSKKVGIRVTCQDIKGVAPKGKSPSVANISNSKCKVDLRIKIWKWNF